MMDPHPLRITSISQCHLDEAWKKGIETILMWGQHVKDERGQKTMEIMNLMLEITKPLSSEIPEDYPLGLNALERYENEMVKPTLDGFVYTYGNRLRYYFISGMATAGASMQKVDQLAETIVRLAKNNNTRRATMVTWDPVEDSLNDEVPCMILVDFKIRGDYLFTTAVWRSHDFFGAYPANFVALRKLAIYVVNELKTNFNTHIKVGPLTTHSISAHIYEHDLDAARKMFRK